MSKPEPKLLFIINVGAGNSKTDWKKEIESYFIKEAGNYEIQELPNPCKPGLIEQLVKNTTSDRIVAVGGDGTVKLVAQCLIGSTKSLGILPAGSANGLAGELTIPDDPQLAINIAVTGDTRKVHLTEINDELCIHLSDIGFNAFVVKKFQDENKRGMWGYVKAAFSVLRQHSKMNVRIGLDKESIVREAVMVVIANATKYGTGVLINPMGTLYDDQFEIVIVKKISFTEILKMRFSSRNLNPEKTEVLQTSELHIRSRKKVHFQVDGEYLGKVNEVHAKILAQRLNVIVPFQ